MSAAPISLKDVVEAAQQAKKIYDEFFDKHQNAPRKFKSFRAELERVEASLQIKWTEERYPGAQDFKNLLEECSDFIEGRRRVLSQESPGGKSSVNQVFQTVLSAFDNKMPKLKQDLHQRRLEFFDWKLDLLLKHVFQRTPLPIEPSEARNGSNSPDWQRNIARNSHVSPPIAPEGQQACPELISPFLGHREVVDSSANEQRENNQPDTMDRLDARLWTILSSVCRLADFPDDCRPPTVTLERVGELLDENRDLISGFQSQAALRHCSLTISFPGCNERDPIQAVSYIIVGRRCIFHNFHNGRRHVVFEHRLRPESFPDTFHRKFEHPHAVRFVGEQDMSVIKLSSNSPLSGETSMKGEVEYFFMTDQEHQRPTNGKRDKQMKAEQEQKATQERMCFQFDLREKQPLHEFHVSRISSKNTGKTGNSNNVCMKLWHDISEPYLTSLSSPGLFGPHKRDKQWLMYEWPLHWFEASIGQKAPKTVMLDFLNDQSSRASVSSSATSGSGSSTGSSARSLPVGDMSKPFAPSCWRSEIRYLRVDFESREEASSFLEAFQQARRATGNPPLLDSSSQPPSEFVTPSTPSSTLPTPLSPLSIRTRRATGSTTSVGTSPMSPTSQRRTAPDMSPYHLPASQLGHAFSMDTMPELSTRGDSEPQNVRFNRDSPLQGGNASRLAVTPSDLLQHNDFQQASSSERL